MWGLFYDEINHVGDGGVYAELIRNRNFAESNLPENTIYAKGKIFTNHRWTMQLLRKVQFETHII